MISTALARELREAGLDWVPVSGDVFQLAPDGERPEGSGDGSGGESSDFEGDVFTVSDMTIEAHSYSTGTVLGFNGTTEWALDSVAIEDALWLPREEQLRELLRGTFLGLHRSIGEDGRVVYTVRARLDEQDAEYLSDDPSEAYGLAVLALIRSARAA